MEVPTEHQTVTKRDRCDPVGDEASDMAPLLEQVLQTLIFGLLPNVETRRAPRMLINIQKVNPWFTQHKYMQCPAWCKFCISNVSRINPAGGASREAHHGACHYRNVWHAILRHLGRSRP